MSLREQWRAYIVGLATGKVPQNIDLLPNEKRKIQNDTDHYIKHDSNRVSTTTKDSGLGASLDGRSLDEQRLLTVKMLAICQLQNTTQIIMK